MKQFLNPTIQSHSQLITKAFAVTTNLAIHRSYAALRVHDLSCNGSIHSIRIDAAIHLTSFSFLFLLSCLYIP